MVKLCILYWEREQCTIVTVIVPLQGLREKRQAADPHQNGRHVFEDGYRFGRVHYSGQDSEVSRYKWVEVG